MIGLDLAKNVFQIHGVDASGQVVMRRQLRRAEVEKFFAKCGRAIVGMEACGSAHHWARVLQGFGHEVRLMPPAYVKPYVKRNKTDGRDAEAICEAMSRPTMRFVAVKSVGNQAIQALHRTRSLLVRQRTMSANALRGALAEFGIVAAQGIKGLQHLMDQLETSLDTVIPAVGRAALRTLVQHWQALDTDIRDLERQIMGAARTDEAARRLMEIPGVGPIGASAIIAAVPDARVFRTARGFAAWLGLTPRQHGTGGKHRSGSISKQGDRTIRTLLILGAMARMRYAQTRGEDGWVRGLLARRPVRVAAVAMAAKTARIIWALLVKGERYRAPGQRDCTGVPMAA